jgi:hypothetical protein
VETETALVRAECRVELHPEATVDVYTAGVVSPRDAEDDLAFRLAEALQDRTLKELGVPVVDRAEAFENLVHGLVELLLTWIASKYGVPDGFEP